MIGTCTNCGTVFDTTTEDVSIATIRAKKVTWCEKCSYEISEFFASDIAVHKERIRIIDELKGIRKVVVNKQPGGTYELSFAALEMYLQRANIDYRISTTTDRDRLQKYGPDLIVWGKPFPSSSPRRDDPYLVSVVEDLGEKANGPNSLLKVIRIPNNIEWRIKSFYGEEWIEERATIWK